MLTHTSCIQIFLVRSVSDPYGVRCTQRASLPPLPLPPNTQGHTGEAKPWISYLASGKLQPLLILTLSRFGWSCQGELIPAFNVI